MNLDSGILTRPPPSRIKRAESPRPRSQEMEGASGLCVASVAVLSCAASVLWWALWLVAR